MIIAASSACAALVPIRATSVSAAFPMFMLTFPFSKPNLVSDRHLFDSPRKSTALPKAGNDPCQTSVIEQFTLPRTKCRR